MDKYVSGAELASIEAGPRYLTTEEIADLVRQKAETVRYWRHVGTGPKSFRLPGSRRVLYAREDVEAWIAAARENA